MKLETENGGTIRNPSEAEIADALRGLDGFAILGHDELTYLQTAGSVKDGFVLEYQEGDLERHFACPDRLPLERVTGAFVAYAKGDASWRTSFQWQLAKSEDEGGCLGLFIFMLVAIFMLVTWALDFA